MRMSLGIELPSELMDGYLVHCAALARRLDTLLLPRQILLAAPAGERVGALSFVHGVPQASTVAGVTHAQDKRLRRTLLNIKGLPTPPGITFSSRGSKSLQKFISRHGYPFVLKEAIGENPSSKIDIFNERELLAALSRMRLRSQDQLSPARSLVTSAYAENMLNLDEDEVGNRVVPPHARLLIEKRISGRYVRCLVCGEEVLTAIEIDNTPSEKRVAVLDRLHPDLRTVVLRAASAIPGLSVASVDLVLEDPVQSPGNQACYVVEICERPRLDTYMEASPHVGAIAADKLVLYQAERSAIQLQSPTDLIAIRMRAESLSEPKVLLPLFRDACNSLRLAGFIRLVQFDGGHY